MYSSTMQLQIRLISKIKALYIKQLYSDRNNTVKELMCCIPTVRQFTYHHHLYILLEDRI